MGIVKEQENGLRTADVCPKHGISEPTFYQCKAKFAGMEVSDARKLNVVEHENGKLKKLLAKTMLDNALRMSLQCMVRLARARGRDMVDDDSSCTNISRLSRVGCGCSQADEIRTRRSQ
ncbi:hypothetical protein CPT34_33115 [Rhizobium sophoriradicis]|uniref:Transposase n=2 Tax=Rhizobium sophoriradicis TaxID=1535245 RepID=A0A2A5KIU5_9HYPH|nr:hypothetical protein CPT34_33115 [Rhizobium sophoriradicis]